MNIANFIQQAKGCVAMQDFAFMPYVGRVSAPPMPGNDYYAQPFSHVNEVAHPGYYSVVLGNRTKIELTVTRRTGIGKFIFPRTRNATLLINAGSSARGTTSSTFIYIDGNNKIRGYATARVGCGKELYTIYFFAEFNRSFSSFGTWNGARITEGSRSSVGSQIGAVLRFDATTSRTVSVKVGVSFVSIDNADSNVTAEDPGWNFERVRRDANEAWNKVLNKIVVSGGTFAQKQVFYTSLYHCFFVPNVFSDADGRYIGMDGKIHTVAQGHSQYENISSWDACRSTTALMALLAPHQESDIAQSLVNDAEQGGGGLPRWEQANQNSAGMVGDGPLILLATDYAFGARDFDTGAALKAMNTDADTVGAESDGNLVRKGLADYMKLGYVPGSASVTLEYEAADFALAQYAKAIGHMSEYNRYLKRSENWQCLYDTSTGYIQPRDSSGSWADSVTPSTSKGYTEGSASQYTWMVPFDLNRLISLMGGKDSAVARLDKYFRHLNRGPGSRYAFMGNEPCESDPWIYDFAGDPAKTQEVVRRIQDRLFTDSPDGLPGNDDGGALSSWYVFSALGLYPEVPGVAGFVVGSPVFPVTIIHLDNGSVIRIFAGNASRFDPYIQWMELDGRRYEKCWIPWSALSRGATLRFGLGGTPSRWGSWPDDAPPDFETVGH